MNIIVYERFPVCSFRLFSVFRKIFIVFPFDQSAPKIKRIFFDFDRLKVELRFARMDVE